MGFIVKALGGLLGMGAQAPKANVAPAKATVDDAAAQAKAARAALIQTAAGTAGSALAPGQTQPGATIFGN